MKSQKSIYIVEIRNIFFNNYLFACGRRTKTIVVGMGKRNGLQCKIFPLLRRGFFIMKNAGAILNRKNHHDRRCSETSLFFPAEDRRKWLKNHLSTTVVKKRSEITEICPPKPPESGKNARKITRAKIQIPKYDKTEEKRI